MSGDPYFNNVSLLLHCDGANGSTTFTDSSTYGRAVTPVGNARISTAQAKFGGSSAYFDGSGDRLTLASANQFNFATGEHTFECWLYPLSWPAAGNYCRLLLFGANLSNSSFQALTIGANAAVYIGRTVAGAVGINTAAAALTLNAWQHVAVVLEGTQGRIYVNGVLKASGTVDRPTSAANAFTIGYDTPSYAISQYYGYLDDLRITQNAARYTAAFTPPTEAFPNESQPPAIQLYGLMVEVLQAPPPPAIQMYGLMVEVLHAPAPPVIQMYGLMVEVLHAPLPPVPPVFEPLLLARCVIPAGRLYFDQGAGERYLGETPGADLSIDLRTVEVYGSDAPVSELLDEVPFGVSRELAFKCLNPSDEVVSGFFGADQGRITQTAGTVTAERLAAVAPGRWYSLGRTASNPTGVRLVSAVTVTDDADPVPTVFVAGRDYTVDPTLGRLYVVPGGTITDGMNLRVDYTRAASTRTRHQGATWLLPRLGGSLRFVAHHTSGPNRDIYVPRVVLRADGAVRIKRAYQDGQVLELGFKARFQRLEDRAALYIDGRAVDRG